MNRIHEYESLMNDLEQTPLALEYAVTRAQTRARRRRVGRAFGVPAASLAGVFAAFALLVNTSVPFASACANIPFLSSLAHAVSISPSLSAAVEHDYVQPVGQSQSANGLTAVINYVIVDQKQLNVFYTLTADDPAYTCARLDCSVLGSLTGFSIYYGDYPRLGELDYFIIDFSQGNMPSHLELSLSLQAIQDIQTDREEPSGPSASFTYALDFDPTHLAQSRTLDISQSVTLNGQTIFLDRLEIYPTHASLLLRDDPQNTLWLKDLDFYLADGDGVRYQRGDPGLSARGDIQENDSLELRVSSPWFSGSGRLTLCLTGASWLDKVHNTVTVDLASGTASGLPEGVKFTGADRNSTDGVLSLFFRGVIPDGRDAIPSLFSTSYLDETGKPCSAEGFGAGDRGDGTFTTHLSLGDYPYSTVTLQLRQTEWTCLDTPIVLSLS